MDFGLKSVLRKRTKAPLGTSSLSDLDTHGYYNKTLHTCVLKLHIPEEVIKQIYLELYHENEVSGIFYVDDHDQITHADRNEGDSGSVYTPNNVINYHTHPIKAYRNGKTCYGCPSGEDYRECLKFALAGNKAHLVFTVEGLYTIQVSPCKIKKMRELLSDEERGVLIFFIEEYFKSIHEFRCVDELDDLSEGSYNVNPYSFVDFANTFDVKNLLTTEKMTFKLPKTQKLSKVGHSSIHSTRNAQLYAKSTPEQTFSRIPNMGFPVIMDTHVVTQPAKQFLQKDDLDNLRTITRDGKETETETKDMETLLRILNGIAKKFDSVPCSIEWNSNPNAWFFVNFFPTKHYTEDHHKKGKKHHMPLVDAKELELHNEPFIRVFSNNKDGCKITDLARKHNFNMGKRFSFGAELTRKKCNCCKMGGSSELMYLNNL
jgi:hypothetical protein